MNGQQESGGTSGYRRLRIIVHGAVQGVGFRPFVYRLATSLGLAGWVNNSNVGVFIEVEGIDSTLEEFLLRLEKEKPAISFIQSLEYSFLDPVKFAFFEIRESDSSGTKSALVLPDIATCPECRQEIFDPKNRRYLYPFTNCTNCGPRYSIIDSLPYDRPNTTMREFMMCEECRREYDNPRDRRFHAQPNACPKCGPHLELWNQKGELISESADALAEAVQYIRDGRILAIKGMGGFHLMVDARDNKGVERLRRLKRREEKPLAVMCPSLDKARNYCDVAEMEARLLNSPESPIVLLKRRKEDIELSDSVAPNNPYLGVMLPYSPLHHIVLKKLGFPVVATSGNISDEPICTDNHEAIERLGQIADFFLVHNRPIARPIDDSVVRFMAGRQMVVRRARGYAPLPIRLKKETPSILAVGGHLKNSIAVSVGHDVFISQHIGDLETEPAYLSFRNTISNLQSLYDVTPKQIACDLHPDYISTHFAQSIGRPVTTIQHHYAHILSCMAENEIEPPALGISWDGTGYGPDKTIWGGEFLKITDAGYERFGHFRLFPLPGGEKAIREPRRSAVGMLFEIYGREIANMKHLAPIASFSPSDLDTLIRMLEKSMNTHYTSSAGRIFDAVAALAGIREETIFEGQTAMELEFALDGFESKKAYSYRIQIKDGVAIVDWERVIEEIIDDINRKTAVREISAKFHNGMTEVMIEMARRSGEKNVVLSGGCFQNRYLTERAIRRLTETGFHPYWHQRVPPNDGGISLGQVVAAAMQNKR